jgi:hypothetical protein
MYLCKRGNENITVLIYITGCHIRDMNCIPFTGTWGHPGLGDVRIVHPFSFLCCVVLLCLFVFVLCLVYPMLPVSLNCLRPVSCVPNAASVSRLSSSCVLCTQCWQCLWIVFVLCLVYPMLPVSLDCLRLVSCVPNAASFFKLSSSCVLCTQCCQCL